MAVLSHITQINDDCTKLTVTISHNTSLAGYTLVGTKQTYNSSGALVPVRIIGTLVYNLNTESQYEIDIDSDGVYKMTLENLSTNAVLADTWYDLILGRGLKCFKKLAESATENVDCKDCGIKEYFLVKAFISAITAAFHVQIVEETYLFLTVYKGIINLTDKCIECTSCSCK